MEGTVCCSTGEYLPVEGKGRSDEAGSSCLGVRRPVSSVPVTVPLHPGHDSSTPHEDTRNTPRAYSDGREIRRRGEISR